MIVPVNVIRTLTVIRTRTVFAIVQAFTLISLLQVRFQLLHPLVRSKICKIAEKGPIFLPPDFVLLREVPPDHFESLLGILQPVRGNLVDGALRPNQTLVFQNRGSIYTRGCFPNFSKFLRAFPRQGAGVGVDLQSRVFCVPIQVLEECIECDCFENRRVRDLIELTGGETGENGSPTVGLVQLSSDLKTGT